MHELTERTAPERQPTPAAGRTPSVGPDLARGSISFIGTATVLIRYAGFTILTDPNFLHAGDHIDLAFGLTAKRRTNPAMELDDLPPLDFVLLSHLHEDHFDRVVQRRLNPDLPIVTTPQAAEALQNSGFSGARWLRTWETLRLEKDGARLSLTAMPARHGPGPLRALLPVMGTMLEFATPRGSTMLRLYISGDTVLFDELRAIPRRFPTIDLALLHLGGARIVGILATMDARQGVEALRLLAPRTAIPIHYDDYTIFKSPLSDFERAVNDAGLAERVRYLARGETYMFRVPAGRLG